MNETFSSLMPYTTDQESYGSKVIGRPGQPDRDLLAYHVNAGWPVRSTSDYSALEKTNVSKSLTMSRSDADISNNVQSRNNRMPVPQHKGLQECKKNLLLENKHLKEQISVSKGLYEELEELRKKLKDETKRRQIAERKVTDALKTTNADDSKEKSFSKNKPSITISTHEKEQEFVTNAHDVKEYPTQGKAVNAEEFPMESGRSLIEKKYVEEREKRIELEGIVSQFREDLKSKTKECAQISVGQKMALALAEQFRAKYEKDSRRNSSDDVSKPKMCT
uniref:Uncharacterized protein n=1 Tax=Lygus hesperus TaxID=30085 RepID=A0A0A9X6J6_LYGHE